MSTLLGELEQARRRSKCGAPGAGCFGCAGCDLADRLQKRIEHVRRLEAAWFNCPARQQPKGAGAVNSFGPCGKCTACVVHALTGDL
jgi:hypothetical protein